MGLIKKEIEERIKSAAKAIDIVTATGLHLRRVGVEWTAISPFRADRHDGSFRVNEQKNIIYDFATGERWTPWGYLMELENITYPQALREIASMYGIYVDEEPVQNMKRFEIRPAAAPLPLITWNFERIAKPFMRECYNPLFRWIRSLPIPEEKVVRTLREYAVGTYPTGDMAGWTIWWQIDDFGYVRTGKMMKYREDGHRDKTECYNGHEPTDWVHSLLKRQKKWDPTKNQIETCLFGQHLLPFAEDKPVCIVESEKTAILCRMLDPQQRLWLATGGKSGWRKLNRLKELRRDIYLFPDHDATDEWKERAKQMDYDKVTVVGPDGQGWREEDGPKADMADILVRYLTSTTMTLGEKVAAQMGAPEKGAVVDELIEKLQLRVIS